MHVPRLGDAEFEHQVRVHIDKTRHQDTPTSINNSGIRGPVDCDRLSRNFLDKVVLDEHVQARRSRVAHAIPHRRIGDQNMGR